MSVPVDCASASRRSRAAAIDSLLAPCISGPNCYATFAGTSGSTPLVSGAAGLLMQLWHEQAWANHGGGATPFDSRPHSATLRALVANTAFRYPLTQGGFTRGCQGWGMPDLQRAHIDSANTWVVNEQHLLGPLQTNKYTISIGLLPELRATLVYRDPMGNPAATLARVNDLSLRVSAPGGAVQAGDPDSQEAHGPRRVELPQQLERDLQELQRATIGLRGEIDRLEHDPSRLEQLARERLGYVRKGETVYQVVPDDADERGRR